MGIDVSEVRRQRIAGQLGDGAREFDPGRARTDNDKGEQRRAPLGIGLALGAFERHQDSAPQRGRVLQRLEAGRERLPFVVAEIRVPRAGGEDERVIGQRIALIEQHALGLRIDAVHRRKQGRDLWAAAHQITDWPGNLGRRQRRGGNLIQQRLEQVMVAPIDQRNADRRTGKAISGFEAAEAGADDHDVMGFCWLWRSGRHGGGLSIHSSIGLATFQGRPSQ